MTPSQHPVALLAEQCRHQVRIARKRMTWWIPLIFVLGFLVSMSGLILLIAGASQEEGPPLALLLAYGFFAAGFGWTVVLSIAWPLRLSPRIVPYFARELGVYGGPTMTAFLRGRALYREIVILEQLAQSLGVKPLSDFGFAYDYYDQDVRWHPATEGLATAEALKRSLEATADAPPGVLQDLDALGSVLRVAADQAVDFSLVLRLHARDAMQGVCTREVRQGAFW